MYILRANEQDLKFIQDSIRKDFDALDMKDIISSFDAEELINRAERFGFKELAKQMNLDLKIKA